MYIPPLEYVPKNSINPLEYVPIVSTFKGLYQIFQTYALPPVEEDFSTNEHSYRLLSGEKTWRSYVMLLPIIGNIVLLGYDKAQESLIKKTVSFLETRERFDDPQLQKLFDEIRALFPRALNNNIHDMKELKARWERLQNDLVYEQEIKSTLEQPLDQNFQKLLSIVAIKLEEVSKKIFYLKKQKHAHLAGPLKYATTFHEIVPLAISGRETEVKAFIKLGQEAQHIQGIKLSAAPESQAAKEMSLLLSLLHNDKNSLHFSFDNTTKKYIAKDSLGDVLCEDFQKTLLHVDWSQVLLEEEKTSLSWSIAAPVWYFVTRGTPFPQGPMKDTEYRALNIDYLRDGYLPMNKLLRGDFFSFDQNGSLKRGAARISHRSESTQIDKVVKKYLLTAAKAIHGLYKLPDYKGPKKYLWRGEKCFNDTLFEAEIQRRIKALGKDPEPSLGFTSTSAHNLMSAFAQKGCLTLLKARGKDVRKYSPYSEQEILLPPTKIQWLYHKTLRDGVHLFIAREA